MEFLLAHLCLWMTQHWNMEQYLSFLSLLEAETSPWPPSILFHEFLVSSPFLWPEDSCNNIGFGYTTLFVWSKETCKHITFGFAVWASYRFFFTIRVSKIETLWWGRCSAITCKRQIPTFHALFGSQGQGRKDYGARRRFPEAQAVAAFGMMLNFVETETETKCWEIIICTRRLVNFRCTSLWNMGRENHLSLSICFSRFCIGILIQMD